jgi:hypothetical protein
LSIHPRVSPATDSSARAKIEVYTDTFWPGDIIKVAARMCLEMHKPGGIGTVKKVDSEKHCLDVKYVMGGMDKNVPFHVCMQNEFCWERQRRSRKKGGEGSRADQTSKVGSCKHADSNAKVDAETDAVKRRTYSAEKDTVLTEAKEANPDASWSALTALKTQTSKAASCKRAGSWTVEEDSVLLEEHLKGKGIRAISGLLVVRSE